MIIEHFATLHSEDEVSIPNRVASCQIDILLPAVCIQKNYMVNGIHLQK